MKKRKLYRTLLVILALARMGSAQPNIQASINLLESSHDATQRKAAAHAIGEIALIFGPQVAAPGIPALLKAKYADSNASVKEEAKTSLSLIGTGKAAIVQYLHAIPTLPLSPGGIQSEAFKNVNDFLSTAPVADVHDLGVVDVLLPYKDSSFPPRQHYDIRWGLEEDIHETLFAVSQRDISQRSRIADIFKNSMTIIGAADPPNYGNQLLLQIRSYLARSGPEGMRALLAGEQTVVLRMQDFTSLIQAWPNLSPPEVTEFRSRALGLCMNMLNTFPDTWRSEYVSSGSIQLLAQLGSFATPAVPKLQRIAAMSDDDARARCHVVGCGQAAARQALQAIQGTP